MRSSSQILVASVVFWMTDGVAQAPADEAFRDLLCEQCPFDAPVRPSPPAGFSPEMRSLGIITIRDMIDQLPSNVVKPPLDLGESIGDLRGISTPIAVRIQSLLNSPGSPDQSREDGESGDGSLDSVTPELESAPAVKQEDDSAR